MKTFLRLAVPILVSLGAPCLGQVPIMLPELPVSVPPPGYSYGWDTVNGVAIGTDGRFIITFAAPYEGSVGGPLRRSFDAFGNPMTLPLSVPSYSGGGWLSDIARDASGRHVIVWRGNDGKVWSRRFAVDGSPLGDEVLISSSITSGAPRVASHPSGSFVVAWTTGGNEADAKARLFDSFGAPRGGEIPVSAFTTGNQAAGGAGMAADGHFVVWWTGDGSLGGGTYVRVFAPSGTPVSDDIRVSSDFASDMSMDAAGRMIFVWGAATTVAGLRVDATGVSSGPVFPIEEEAPSTVYGARVASNSAGNFLVTWGYGDSSARFFDSSGTAVGPKFQANQYGSSNAEYWTKDARPSLADNGSFVIAWTSEWYCCLGYTRTNVNARQSAVRASNGIEVGFAAPDSRTSAVSAPNDSLEPGETVTVATAWENVSFSPVEISGSAPFFTGPAGATYSIVDGTAYYGVIGAGQRGSCYTAGNCYSVAVSAPSVRPIQHWDAQLQENLNIGVPKTWALHVGGSFADVPASSPFYKYVETIFHNRVTAGCFGGGYCPGNAISRAQMAVFLLKAKYGPAHVPPPCTGTVFTDVPCTGGMFDSWIEEIAALGITAGCGGGFGALVEAVTQPQIAFCPNDAVTREQMSVFLLKAAEGAAYAPPLCAGVFLDVPCTPGSGSSDWIEELARRGITGGCSASPALYCPTRRTSRGQMAVFLTKTFGLGLYGGS